MHAVIGAQATEEFSAQVVGALAAGVHAQEAGLPAGVPGQLEPLLQQLAEPVAVQAREGAQEPFLREHRHDDHLLAGPRPLVLQPRVGLRRHIGHPVPLWEAAAVDRLDADRRRGGASGEDAVEEEGKVGVAGSREVEPCGLRRHGDVVGHPWTVAAAHQHVGVDDRDGVVAVVDVEDGVADALETQGGAAVLADHLHARVPAVGCDVDGGGGVVVDEERVCDVDAVTTLEGRPARDAVVERLAAVRG